MKKLIFFIILLTVLCAVQRPFVRYMTNKTVAERVGFVASPAMMRFAAADHKETVSALLTIKSLLYYGNLVELQRDLYLDVDFSGLHQLLVTASRLDPYNEDIYYFSQAILGWQPEYVRGVIELLNYGMAYRSWDYMLPFWAGFDSANFLRDYPVAARYYQQAGELSGAAIFKRLTARYLFEANQTSLAIAYLSTMVKGAKNPVIRQSYQRRLDALEAVRRIEHAVQSYQQQHGCLPASIKQLVQAGDLKEIPVDPFGGSLLLDAHGRPYSTSQFLNRSK